MSSAPLYIALYITLLILQPFRHFTYVTTYSPTLLSLYLCHSSFSNPSVASPTSQIILQPFFCFSYVTSSSLNSPGEPPMFPSGFPTRTLYILGFLHMCYIYCPSHIYLDLRFLIMLGEKCNACSSALCNFLHSLAISSLLAQNIFQSTLFF